MTLFKSKAQRKLERDMEVRKGAQTIRRNIRSLEKNIKEYREKAVRAKQIEANDQLQVVRDAIRRSIAQICMQERQLLAIETAIQMRNQAETMSQFAASMAAVSSSISAAFGSADMDLTMANYEKAMSQAQDMEERMNLFLDMSADVMASEGTAEEFVSMEEVDRIIDDDLQAAETKSLDERIDAAIAGSAEHSSV